MRHVLAFSTSLLLASVAGAVAADLTASESKRLDEAAAVVREFKAAPDNKGIPEDLWNKAECITVIPNMKKAAFMIGGEYGKGVMSCRTAGSWSAPVFIELEKGSAGFQIGGEQVDLILLMMNRTGVDKLLQDKVTLGGDAAVAAGPVGRMASAGTDVQLHAGILAYSRAEGAFAGVNISGGVLKPDTSANEHAYGASIAPSQVLAKNDAAAPAAAQSFLRTLKQETRATSGRK
jgi:lipid-binding SYLF domain-containing protein